MENKLSLASIVAISLYISIPFFRPILITHNLIIIVYALFFLSLLILLININKAFKGDNFLFILLISYASVSTLTTLISDNISFSNLGLLYYLIVSFLLGSVLSTTYQSHTFFRIISIIFIPLALYIVAQLSISGFSYNTYYYWSNSSYKIDYLTSSMFSLILFIYFSINGRNIIESLAIPIFCALFVMISGARFSIIFFVISAIYIAITTIKKSPEKSIVLGIFAAPLSICLLYIFWGSIKSEALNLANYSIFRMSSLFNHDTSVSGRVSIINNAIDVISSNFVTGVGAGGSGEALNSNYPHNILLEAFIDGGFFSAIILLLFVVRSIYIILRFNTQKTTCFLLISFYLIGSYLKSFSIYESRILFFFLGYTASLAVIEFRSTVKQKSHAIG